MAQMITRKQWRRFIDHPVVEWAIFALGVILLLLTPIIGALPGPGGVIVGGIGLALILKTSMWARRHYVRVQALAAEGRTLDGLGAEASKRAAARGDAQGRASREPSFPAKAPAIDFRHLLHYRRARQRLPLGRPFFILDFRA